MNCPPHIAQNFQVAPAADQSLCSYEGVPLYRVCEIVLVFFAGTGNRYRLQKYIK